MSGFTEQELALLAEVKHLAWHVDDRGRVRVVGKDSACREVKMCPLGAVVALRRGSVVYDSSGYGLDWTQIPGYSWRDGNITDAADEATSCRRSELLQLLGVECGVLEEKTHA